MRTKTNVDLSLLAALWVLLGCNLCKEKVWQQLLSPDGKWTATVVMRDCGATTSELVSVNVHPTNEKRFDAKGTVLVLKHGSPGIGWKDNATLEIDCPDCDVYNSVNQLGSIHIDQNLPPGRH
jgi:hypothetical protein